MRYLFFLLTFYLVTAASGQDDPAPKYVWAESGLTMRAEGQTGAKKVLVVPFGATVQPTGRFGREVVEVTALKSIAYKQDGRAANSDPYVMRAYYQEVTYNGTTGFVYGGFLSRLSPLVDGQPTADIYEWLEHHWGKPREVMNESPAEDYSGHHAVVHYPKGVLQKTEQFEGGGGTVFIFPLGSINDGFLIAEQFLSVTDAVNAPTEEEEYEFLPELLNVKEDGTLEFSGDMSTTTIQVIGGLLIISSFGGG